jgi:exopolysaccharide production protein ExoQ
MLGLGVAVLSFGVLIPLVYAGKVVRAWATSMLAITLVVVAANYQTLSSALVNLGATLFDKDSTLTGRTYLWYRAAELIHEKPVLGRGYNAFWVQGNTDAEGLWQYFGIVDRDGFTFHNTYVQTLVELGWVGLMLVLATVTVGVVFLIRRFVQKPSLALVFWIGIMMYEVARTPIEVVGILPFYWSSVFIFGALGAAFSRERAKRPQTGATSSALSIATPVLVSIGQAPLSAQRQPRPRRAALRLVKSGPEGGL